MPRDPGVVSLTHKSSNRQMTSAYGTDQAVAHKPVLAISAAIQEPLETMVLDTHPWVKKFLWKSKGGFQRSSSNLLEEEKKNRSLDVLERVRTLISNMKIHNTLLKVYRRLFYVSLIVTTKQKPAVDSQKEDIKTYHY